MWLLEHPQEARQMGENGRRAVEANYTWECEEKKLVELYENLLSPDGEGCEKVH
jgi:glycosyltransferase involved in cell wall biosynthesis